jgi:hypothetical protein
VDPHINAPRDSLAKIIEPLSPWFVRPVLDFSVADAAEIVAYFQYMLDEFTARQKPNGTIGKQPLFCVIDEWNELVDLLDDDELAVAVKAVRTIARGGRKYQMWVCLAAQNWNLEATGGSQVRKNIPGRIAFNAEMADLRLILNTRDIRALNQLCIPPLGKGEAIMKRAGIGIHRVRFIYCERRNCADVAHLMHKVFGHFDISDISEPENVSSEMSKDFSAYNAPGEPNRSWEIFMKGRDKKVRVSRNEWEEITKCGTKLLQTDGKVVRTKIMNELGYKGEKYAKVAAVCDAFGWSNRMANKELTTAEKQALREQAGECAKCGATGVPLEVDHIWPKSKGGTNETSNVQLLCRKCNASKGAQ